jgi:hypothetical protein
MLKMETAVKSFFSSPKFAVAGASQNPGKFGYKGRSSLQAANLKCQSLITLSLRSSGMVPTAWTTGYSHQPNKSSD